MAELGIEHRTLVKLEEIRVILSKRSWVILHVIKHKGPNSIDVILTF
jgi:hypothetical protein